MALIHTAGFVIGPRRLVCVRRARLRQRALVRDLAIGLVLGLAVFLFFVKFLNVRSAGGVAAPVLGGAGI